MLKKNYTRFIVCKPIMMLDACIVHTYLKYACKKSYIHAWMCLCVFVNVAVVVMLLVIVMLGFCH